MEILQFSSFGVCWGLLGPSWGCLGPSWVGFGPVLAVFGNLFSLRTPFVSLLWALCAPSGLFSASQNFGNQRKTLECCAKCAFGAKVDFCTTLLSILLTFPSQGPPTSQTLAQRHPKSAHKGPNTAQASPNTGQDGPRGAKKPSIRGVFRGLPGGFLEPLGLS